MKAPELTIITPVFNGERYLDEVISSIVNQKNVDLQLVIVNDGSTDRSLQIALDWEKRYPDTIEIINQSNAGEATAVNNGRSRAVSEFVGIVNADDPLLPGHCRRMLDTLLQNPKAVVAYPDWLMLNSNGKEIRKIRTIEYSMRALIADLVCIPGPGAVIRTSAIEDFPIREKEFRYISDYVLWIRLANKGEFVRVPEFLATWRQHSMGATATANSGAISAEIHRLVENRFFDYAGDTISEKWMRSAIAHAKYYAALGALDDRRIPGRRLLVQSFFIKPYPNFGYPTHHRSIPAMTLIFLGIFGRVLQQIRKWIRR
jgi:glycosyltransferase involved in cell wall biosynthesis